jgi:hypothetical protein
MVLARPSLKPWIRAANAWTEGQKPSQYVQTISIIYKHIFEYMLISYCPSVQEVLEQFWHQLQKVAALLTHTRNCREKSSNCFQCASFLAFPMIGLHQGV